MKEIDGIKCYAPSLAISNDGLNREDFEKLSKIEDVNFWFRIRNKIIKHLVKKFAGTKQKSKFLEIGCGNGFVLKGLSEINND